MLRQSLRDAAIALSLANLFFIGAWIPILDASYDWPNKFHDRAPNNIVNLMLDVLVLGCAFFAAITFARCSRNRVVLQLSRGAFFFALLVILGIAFSSQFGSFHFLLFVVRRINYFNITELRVLGAIAVLLSALVMLGRYRWIIAALLILTLFVFELSELEVVAYVLAVPATFAMVRWHRRIIRTAAGVALVFFPLCLICFFQGIVILSKDLASVANAPYQPQSAQMKSRAIWIIFDEMDYSLAFSKRPSTLVLPELDRLQGQSVRASNAYPPADYTLVSIPALITGRLVSKANPLNLSEVMLNFEDDSTAVSWSSQPNVFSRANALGANTGLIGWYHPYETILGRSLTYSYVRDTRGLSFPKGMLAHLEEPLKAAGLSASAKNLAEIESRWERENFLSLYGEMMAAAKRAATNTDLALVLIHYPIPHPPGIYNRAEERFIAEGESSYLDGLALADRSLGELRRAMEEAGLWESAFVLVSSDHWWRPYIWQSSLSWSPADDEFVSAKDEINHRVPFLLKTPGQTGPVVYDSAFNTVLTHDLLLSILRGEVSDPAGVSRWIDQHRTIAESPYGYEKSKQ